MPSPTSSTVPTERVSAPTSKASMADLMMLVMSWERRAMGGILLEGARGEPAPQPLQAASDTPVDQAVAEPHDDAAEQARSDVRGQLDAAAGELLEAGRQGADLVRVERRRAGGGGVDDAVAQIVEAGGGRRPPPAGAGAGPPAAARGGGGGGGVGRGPPQPLLAQRRGRCGRLAAPGLDGAVAQGDGEGGVGVAPGGAGRAGHPRHAPPPGLTSARNSSPRGGA